MKRLNLSPVQTLAMAFALAEVLLALGVFWAIEMRAV